MSEVETADDTQLEYEHDTGVVFVFGRQLKRFRTRAGLERRDLGAATGYAPSAVASFEQGRRIPPDQFIDKADEVLDAGGVLKEMKEEVRKAQYPAFFRDAARLEAEAVELHAYDTHMVNGLLQTEEYARRSFEMRRPVLDEATIERLVVARMARQEIFTQGAWPLMSFVIEEAVLRRPIGGADVLRGQLEHLLLFGQRRNVEIQVMPTEQEEHAGLAGPFKLLRPARVDASPTPRCKGPVICTRSGSLSANSKRSMGSSVLKRSLRVSRRPSSKGCW
ncbi:helix-turn-helix transcriptional regulator [Streptomyces glaucosporus]|uniref:Helix-turn-helix transcriptional regulator n=1 Tax=Streptomyces glaucosporus TaxID=284044 RepID=A0ABN3IHT7_9ACTN